MPLILVLEVLGLVCLVAAAALLHPALALAAAGVALIGKAYELESRGRKR